MIDGMPRPLSIGGVIALLIVLASAGLFLVDPISAEPAPVDMTDTIVTGLTQQDEQAIPDEAVIPGGQVFYSRYRYVVGYRGVEGLVAADQERRAEQFGPPQVIYVHDFAGTDPELTPAGHLVPDGNPSWTTAEDAVYVVDSEARVPSGPIAVPFGDRDAASAFAEEYGGTIESWAEFRTRDPPDGVEVVRDSVDDTHDRADQQVAAALERADRPVSTRLQSNGAVVTGVQETGDAEETTVTEGTQGTVKTGETQETDGTQEAEDTQETDDSTATDEPDTDGGLTDETNTQPENKTSSTVATGTDIQTAIDATPAGTTLELEPANYSVADRLEIDRPITLRGSGAHLHGEGNGTIIRVTHDGAAISNVSIAGVGDELRRPEVIEEQEAPENETVDDIAVEDPAEASATEPDAWSPEEQLGYGHGDAGIAVVEVADVVIADVIIDSPANGVLLRDSANTTVHTLAYTGGDQWRESFMGVMVMRSTAVVENSTFHGGRDGVYFHQAEGTVVRDSYMEVGRYGLHLMYTGDTLLADNTLVGTDWSGIIVMTRPTRNAIVGNVAMTSNEGIYVLGSDSYVADNVLVNNDKGLQINAQTSIYEDNLFLENDLGVSSGTALPTDQVRRNDFVGNHRHADATGDALQIWTVGEEGNYWEGAPGRAHDSVLDRSFVPTDPVDGIVHRTPGATTVASSPAVTLVRGVRGTTPGLRGGSIIDLAPRATPANPERIENRTAGR